MCFSIIIRTNSVYYLNNKNYFKGSFGPIQDYRKTVIILFSIKNDVDILRECGFSNNDFNCLCMEFENLLK